MEGGEVGGSMGGIGLAPREGPVFSEGSLVTALDLVVELSGLTVREACATSVTMVRGGRACTLASSGEQARRLDEVQYAAGGGPSVAAALEGIVSNVVVAEEARRWPGLAAAAAGAGVASILSLPLKPGGDVLAGLNVYSDAPRRFGDDEQRLAWLFASQAAEAVANAVTSDQLARVTSELREALVSRDLIGQAKGILIARGARSPDDAFDMLRRASQRMNRKLRDVAADLVASTLNRRPAGR
jgi:GAF domain-containing protein